MKEYSKKGERGYIAFITIMILMLLISTGMAYLKWSADESVEFKRQYAALQAYYLAQSALAQDIIPYLCQLPGTPTQLNMQGSILNIDYTLPPGMEGEYKWSAFLEEESIIQSTYSENKFYSVEVTGKVMYTAFNRFNDDDEIEVDTTLYIKFESANTWGIFLYLTNYEETLFGEKIKFFSGDTLWGWVHSNDEIAVMQSPVFMDRVSSCARDFWYGPNYNPILYEDPMFNHPPVEFPTTLDDLRAGAAAQGRFYSYPGYQFRMVFHGTGGSILYKWPIGLPFSDTLATTVATIPVLTNGAVFVIGRLEMMGTFPEARIDWGVQGRISVGCSGDMWLMDNLRYVDSDPVWGTMDSNTTNMLGLMSESYVLIDNSWENGRDDGGNLFSYDSWRSSIIINGGIIALGESFSFEDQNDVLTAYGGNLPEWYYSEGPSPDERGHIRLWGQVSQYRRGYVHRSNHGGTGYYKDYHYDARFYFDPPPFYPYLDDTFGTDRQISAWGAGPVPGELPGGEEP
ncbi:MAG: hypothetical protein HQ591_12390 [candidate division Zixibacteria bacterium]|nr:hypothetical protein [Candidatus Tariuqbacter arcticus]